MKDKRDESFKYKNVVELCDECVNSIFVAALSADPLSYFATIVNHYL